VSDTDASDALTMLAGTMLLAVGASDLHLRYVKPEMQPLLLVSGAVLLGLGLRGVLRVVREQLARRAGEREAGEHQHALASSSWLIALPFVVLVLVAPPSLGSYAAARSETRIAEPTVDLPSLPSPRDGAVDLTLTDYYTRVLYEPESLEGARVRLVGFVTPVGGRWYVTRMSLSCCAADGRPVKVLTAGPESADLPEADSWVEVVGRVVEPERPPGDVIAVPTLEVEALRSVEAPTDQYE
jgi:uncharacterized repeat protein (TIGR03943 family)